MFICTTILNCSTSIYFNIAKKLTAITLPEGLKEIRLAALSHCGFRELTIPDSVITIGNYAFDYNNQLETVVIGKSVASIGDFAFDGCKKLNSVITRIPA